MTTAEQIIAAIAVIMTQFHTGIALTDIGQSLFTLIGMDITAVIGCQENTAIAIVLPAHIGKIASLSLIHISEPTRPY